MEVFQPASNTAVLVPDNGFTWHMRYIASGHHFQGWTDTGGSPITSLTAFPNHRTIMSVLPSGRVGIGTTIPLYPLDVFQGTVSASVILQKGKELNNDWTRLDPSGAMIIPSVYTTCNVGIGTSIVLQKLHIEQGHIVVPTGNLGVGTTRPLHSIHVHEGHIYARSNILVSKRLGVGIADTASPMAQLHIQHPRTDGVTPVYVSDTTGEHAFIILDNGNIGIGSSAPHAKLVVNGNIVPSSPVAVHSLGTYASPWSNVVAKEMTVSQRIFTPLTIASNVEAYTVVGSDKELVRFVTSYKSRMNPSFMSLRSSIYNEPTTNDDRPRVSFTAYTRGNNISRDVMTITEHSVGIHTTTPISSLHIAMGDVICASNVGIGTTVASARLHIHHPSFGVPASREMFRATTSSGTIIAIDSQGNIGLGTSIPFERVTVGGNIVPSVSSLHNLGTSSRGWSNMYLTHGVIITTGHKLLGTPSGFRIATPSDAPGRLESGDVYATGTVRAANLEVFGSNITVFPQTFTKSNVFIELLDHTSDFPALSVTSTAGAPIAQFINQNEVVMHIGVNGRVGIGTTSALATLQIRNNGSQPALYVSGGAVGIGVTAPAAALHVAGSIQATGFLQSTISQGSPPITVMSTTMVTNLNSEYLDGQPKSYYRNATNINDGTLAIAFGGTGANTLTQNKLLVGNGTSAILQPTNLHWDGINNRLGIGTTAPSQSLHVAGNVTALSYFGDGTNMTFNNPPNFSGILKVNSGGTGTSNLTPNKLLVGNGSNSVVTPTNLHWDGANLGIGTTVPTQTLHVQGSIKASSTLISTVPSGTAPLEVSSTTKVTNLNADLLDGQDGTFYQNANNINAGTLSVSRGGTGTTTMTPGKVLVGNSTSAIVSATNLHWDNTNSRLGINQASPVYSLQVEGNAYIASPSMIHNTRIGDATTFPTYAFFAHRNTGSEYAMLQQDDGTTYINCAAGKEILFRRNNVDIAKFKGRRLEWTGSEPGAMIQVYYGDGDSYGFGQYSGGTVRIFGASTYGDTNFAFCTINTDNSFTNILAISKSGVVHVTGSPKSLIKTQRTGSGYYWEAGTDNNDAYQIYNNFGTGQFMVHGQKSWSQTSDARTKKDITPIMNALSIITNLNPVRYRAKDDSETSKLRLGLVAQDVLPHLPEIVDIYNDRDLGDDMYALRYTDIIPVLIGAIKDLKANYDALRAEMQQLRALISYVSPC